MPAARAPLPNEVDQLLLNARLRDEFEPFMDEAYECLGMHRMTTATENDFLRSMLAWERAATIPIAEWFDPALQLPHPDRLNDEQLHDLLWQTIHKLFDKRIVLDFTDHLSDRELYTLILRDILPSPEKKLDLSDHYLHWDCSRDTETWLRYYATDEERMAWVGEEYDPLPPQERPPHCRKLPRRPL